VSQSNPVEPLICGRVGGRERALGRLDSHRLQLRAEAVDLVEQRVDTAPGSAYRLQRDPTPHHRLRGEFRLEFCEKRLDDRLDGRVRLRLDVASDGLLAERLRHRRLPQRLTVSFERLDALAERRRLQRVKQVVGVELGVVGRDRLRGRLRPVVDICLHECRHAPFRGVVHHLRHETADERAGRECRHVR